MVASASNFYSETWVGFSLKIRKSSQFKANRKSVVSSKNGTRDFQNSLPFERSACFFMWQSVKVSNVFNTSTLKQIFWKTKTFFKNLEYRFLVEITKIENTSFQFKTALSEDNVKANSMATTKWTYRKEWSFASKYFWKICSSFRTF